MDIRLNDKEIEVSEEETVGSLIDRVKEELSTTNERLVGIKLDGDFLVQSELDERLEQNFSDKEIELVTETTDELADEMVVKALNYIDSLEEWSEDISCSAEGSVLSNIDTDEIEQLLEGFHWLNLALEELVAATEVDALLGGRSFPKFMSENRAFLNEIQGALENPEGNPRLIGTLMLQDLPDWIDEYRDIFLDIKGKSRRNFDA
ncbi:MAG: hypothetical protein ACOC7Z_00945 [Candidatus Bipolaricaulota bacterium]